MDDDPGLSATPATPDADIVFPDGSKESFEMLRVCEQDYAQKAKAVPMRAFTKDAASRVVKIAARNEAYRTLQKSASIAGRFNRRDTHHIGQKLPLMQTCATGCTAANMFNPGWRNCVRNIRPRANNPKPPQLKIDLWINLLC